MNTCTLPVSLRLGEQAGPIRLSTPRIGMRRTSTFFYISRNGNGSWTQDRLKCGFVAHLVYLSFSRGKQTSNAQEDARLLRPALH
jgi:hypothetical protein